MLDIVPGYNLVQYQGNIIMQPWENGKNPNFGHSLGSPKFLLEVRQCSKLSSYKISRKTNGLNFKKITKETNFGHNFWPVWPTKFFLQVLPLLVLRHCSKLSSYSI